MSSGSGTAFESFNEIATIRIEIEDSDPLIWREVEAPTSMTLKALHETIQALMGWFDYHLWEFSCQDGRYGPVMDDGRGDTPRLDAGKVRLRDIVSRRKTVISYVYDFGDDWRRRIIVTNIRQGEPDIGYPRYMGGEYAAPPEDCGGLPGFYDMLDALGDPEHPAHAEANEYLEDYDPNVIDELPVKYALGRIAARRNAARKRLTKQGSE